MANKNLKYESVIVFVPELDEAGVKAQLDKVEATIKTHGGSVSRQEIWGRRELAYVINKKSYGIYAMVVFEADNALVQDLERQLSINDSVLRSLFVKKDKFAPDLTASRKFDDSFGFESLSASYAATTQPSREPAAEVEAPAAEPSEEASA